MGGISDTIEEAENLKMRAIRKEISERGWDNQKLWLIPV